MSEDVYSVNNNQLGWASITVKTGGDTLHGFFSVSYADARERVKAYGLGRHHAPRGRSPGKYTVENGKLGGWKSAIQALRERLAAQSDDGKSYGNVEFQIVIGYFEDDEAITVELNRCVIAKNSSSEEENPDPLKEEIEIDIMSIRRNGLALFDGTEGSPS